MRDRLGLALVVSAPSGAGKTTLLRKLLENSPRLSYSVSYTTRKPRPGEKHGRDYFFVSEDEFTNLVDLGFFAEWAEVHGHRYGTPLEWVQRQLAQGRDLLFDVDVQGAASLKQSLGQGLYVFILPPSREVLEQRLRARATDDEETIQRRIANAPKEIAKARWFSSWIVNDDLDLAAEELRGAYIAESLAPVYHPGALDELLSQWEDERG